MMALCSVVASTTKRKYLSKERELQKLYVKRTATNLPAGLGIAAAPEARMDLHGFSDDDSIFEELANGVTRIGIGDFRSFVRIKPDLVSAALEDGGRQTLLKSKGAEVGG